MKKLLIKLGLLMALPFTALQTSAAVPEYDMAKAKTDAQADFANWMKYLPDDVFVAHVSIPGTHDTATGHGFQASGLMGATSSQTQNTTIEQQLAGGVRAFDLRPGTSGGTLYCTHGVAVTKYTMEYVLDILTQYLEDHPGEFFIIHLFKGNVDSANDTFNKLIDDCFNKKYAGYIIDYDPRLKVKDVRGKMILLRRDRLDFMHFEKAGNLGYWPWDTDIWTENHERLSTPVINASDPTIKGAVRVSDISKFPKDDSDIKLTIDDKKTAVTNLYNWCKNQPTPNSTKNILYKPDWTITFTSGEYVGVSSSLGYKGGRRGYAYTAEYMNPYYTDLILNSEKKGPCGILFSDWVLIDSYTHDNAGYAQDFTFRKEGKDLVSTVAYNNFDYIGDYILDDEYFNENIVLPENIWEEGKEYFLRNVGTGELLTAGATWGSRAALNPKEGLPVKFVYNDAENSYQIKTTLGNNNGMGYDGFGYFMDFGGLETFVVERASAGKFCFKVKNWDRNGVTQALGAISVTEDYDANDHHKVTLPYVDGTKYVAHAVAYNKEDPMQQWEVIDIDDHFASEAAKGSYKTPADVSFIYRIKGHKFAPNESSWSTTTNNNGKGVWSSIGAEPWVDMVNNKQCLLHCTNTKASSGFIGMGATTQYTVWKINKTFTLNKAGKYKVRFKTTSDFNYNDSNMPFTFKINGNDMKVKLKPTKSDYTIASDVINAFKTDPDKYTVELDLELGDDASISFDIEKSATTSETHFWMDDVELLYYGTDPTKRYVVLVRAMADAKRRLADMGKTMDFSEYEEGMLSNAYSGQGEEPALEIYKKLRDLTYEQTPDDSNSHQDYTNAIINAGFETGTMMGWETSYEGDHDVDTGVRPATGDYAMSTNHNDFLFNAAQTDPDPENKARGVILSQKIPNLPAGHYILTAEASNDPGNCIYITVNDQKSEAKVLSGNDKTGEMITFGFEVAENTEEVTISFMGGNSDGSFDEFGGNWYKLDDIHLYRTGAADLCVFFNRLSEAINRSDVIARKTMPEYYQKLWETEDYRTTIDNMIKEHLASGHKDGDLDGSNGLAERTELFNHLSHIVLSQAETKANMSGAIRNNSFELGDLSYWNTLASPIATNLVTNGKYKDGTPMEDFYQVDGKDDNYIYFSKLPADPDNLAGNGESYPIYQSISGLPAGQYELSVWIASTPGNKFYLAANGVSKEITAKSDIKFQNEIVTFTIEEDCSDLLLGLYPSADGTFVGQESQALIKGPWFAVDDFELHLVGRQVSIDWVMETPTHGTIILPFDHEVPAKLEIYSLKEHTDPLAQVATHKILVYEKQDKINANTPYVVKRADAGEMPAAKSVGVKAASADDADLASRTYHFSGFTTNENMAYDDDEYKNGVLTGVLVPTEVEGSQYHLQSYEDNVGFVLHKEGPDHDALEPYHAYITLSEDTEQPETIHGLYFEEPSLPLEWMMEGDYYGTIILPFDAELPAEKDMKAYKLTIGDEAKEFGINAEGQYRKYTYQMIALDEGTTDLKANTPYLVIKNDAFVADEEETEPLNFMNLRLKPLAEEADDDEEDPRMVTFKGVSAFDNNEFSDGVMTGVHQDSSVDASDKNIYTLVQDGKTGMFISNDLGNSSDIAKNHAYIRTTSESPVHFLMLTEPQSENDPNDVETGIDEILAANANVDVYTTGGILLSRDVPAAEALAKLAPGIYILRSGKLTVKVIK